MQTSPLLETQGKNKILTEINLITATSFIYDIQEINLVKKWANKYLTSIGI